MTLARLPCEQAASVEWDVIVIGGGPGGSVAARQSARAGFRTLLVDKQDFPRPKVCGACLNSRAIKILYLLGMKSCLDDVASVRLEQFAIHCGLRRATLPLPGGAAIARHVLDTALVDEACRAGVSWLPKTMASVGELADDGQHRWVELTTATGCGSHTVRTRLVLVADGLSGSSLHHRATEFSAVTHPSSRIGLGGVVSEAPSSLVDGTIYMAVAPSGYVGLVRLSDGSLNIAAALQPAWLRQYPDVGDAVASIVDRANLPKMDLDGVIWKGTPPLTRRIKRPVAARILVLGDAAGYVEPFTGEGMAWSILSGVAAANLVSQSNLHWSPRLESEWIRTSRQLIGRHQTVCRMLAMALRSYRFTSAAVGLLQTFPSLATPLVAQTIQLPNHVTRYFPDSRGEQPCGEKSAFHLGVRDDVPSKSTETIVL